jgi:RimJ/RimL family protein N-acetyltransferase
MLRPSSDPSPRLNRMALVSGLAEKSPATTTWPPAAAMASSRDVAVSACSSRTRLRGVSATVTLEPWGNGDLPLLERLMGDPRMTEHLGGPESPDKLRERQGRYEGLEGGDRMFKIVDVASGAGVDSVGFWTKEWHDEQAYEVGWMVVPEFQGRGIAVAATAQAIELAKRDDKHRFMHAFPNVDNAPSNAICRKLGFELLGACEFEFPKGHFMTCSDWRLDLRA